MLRVAVTGAGSVLAALALAACGTSGSAPAALHVTTTSEVTTTTALEPQCFTAAQAWQEFNQTGCVTFTVGYTYESDEGNCYLDQYPDYTQGIEVWIPYDENFGPQLISEYADETIDVSGTIVDYYGTPEIIVTSPSQVELAR